MRFNRVILDEKHFRTYNQKYPFSVKCAHTFMYYIVIDEPKALKGLYEELGFMRMSGKRETLCLLANLSIAHSRFGKWLIVPLNSNYKLSSYRSFKRISLVKTINKMVEAGYIEKHISPKKYSRIRPTRKFFDWMVENVGTFVEIKQFNIERVTMKKSESVVVSPVSRRHDRTSRLLERYDKLVFEDTNITSSCPGTYIVGTARRFKYNDRSVGRFFSDIMSMSKDDRETLKFNGQPTTELDFPSMMCALAYASKGLDWYSMGEDAYNVNGYTRNQSKALMTRMYATSPGRAINSLLDGQWRGDLDCAHLKMEQWRELAELLIQKHEPIADILSSTDKTICLSMMFLESCITEKVIERFTNIKIPVITIHDSYIVSQENTDELKQTMTRAFNEVTGLDVKYIPFH